MIQPTLTRRLIITTVLALAGVAPASASAADTRLSPNPTATGVAAYGGIVVSSRRLDDGSWVLAARQGGTIADVPGVTSASAIDADLGPSASGTGVSAVYTRCASAKSCALYRYEFATAREAKVPMPSAPKGCRIGDPSVYRASIAAAQSCGARTSRDALLLRSGGHWRTLFAFHSAKGLYGPGQTDLGAHDVVCSIGGDLESDIWRQPLSGRGGRLIFRDRGPAYDVSSSAGSLTIAGAWVYFASYDGGEDGTYTGIQRVPIGGFKDTQSLQDETTRHFSLESGDDENRAGLLDSVGYDAGALVYAVHPGDADDDPHPAITPGVFLAPRSSVHFKSD